MPRQYTAYIRFHYTAERVSRAIRSGVPAAVSDVSTRDLHLTIIIYNTSLRESYCMIAMIVISSK